MSNFIAALKSELSGLEADLRKDPRFQKMERIRELLLDYEDGPQGTLFADSKPVPPAATVKRKLTDVSLSPKAQPKHERVRQEITTLLKRQGQAHRKELLKRLIDRGVMGHEQNPMASLAAYLSGFKDEFEFDGNGNYSLRAKTGDFAS